MNETHQVQPMEDESRRGRRASDASDRQVRAGLPGILGHLGAVWLAGLVGAGASGFLVVMAFALRFPLLLVPSLVLLAGLFYLVGGFSRRVVPLASRPGGRLLWASIVTVGGVIGAAFVTAVTDATGEPEPRWVALGLITVPFPSTAALMVGPRPVRAVIGLLLIVTVAVAGWLPGATLPHDDGASRLEHAGLGAELALSSELPGSTQRSVTFENDALVTELYATTEGGADVPSHVTVAAIPAQTATGCEGRTDGAWELPDVERCIEDADGSLYQRGGGLSAYIVRRGDIEIHAFSHERASRQLLRDAAHRARPATEAELKEALDPAPGHADREVWRHFLQLWGRLIDDPQ